MYSGPLLTIWQTLRNGNELMLIVKTHFLLIILQYLAFVRSLNHLSIVRTVSYKDSVVLSIDYIVICEIKQKLVC